MINPQLTVAKRPEMYVGLPFEDMENTMATLEEKYVANKDATDKLQIAANNMKVLAQDDPLKQQAIGEVNKILEDVVKNGDYEKATLSVRSAAKQFAMDERLAEATKSYQLREAEKTALQDKVGKPFEEGGITMEDYNREMAKADKNYTGIYKDDKGIWRGHYNVKTPPAYLDRGEYIDKFLDGWESNKKLGELVKNEDGKWYRATWEKTPDGTYHVVRNVEEASDTDIYKAAREHLMQNQHIKDRVAYELSNDERTFDDFNTAGINRQAMILQLKALGYTETELNALSNDVLADRYKEEMTVYSSVAGAVDKHSFKKESMQVIGETWDSMLRKENLRKARESGGDDISVFNDKAISQFVTEGFSVANVPKTIDDYQKNMNTYSTEINKRQITLDQLQRELAKNPDDPTLPARIAKVQTQKQEYERLSEEYNYWFEKAVKSVTAGDASIPKKVVDDYFKGKLKVVQMENDPDIQLVKDMLGPRQYLGNDKYGGNRRYTEENWGSQRTNELYLLLTKGKITQKQYDKFLEFGSAKTSEENFIGEINRKGSKTMDAINKEMNRQASEITTSYGYVDLSVDEFGKTTAFSDRYTTLLRNNADNFKILETNGKAVSINNLDEDHKYDPQNTKIIGVTTQYVGEHGYLLVGLENVKSEVDGKEVTEIKRHLFVPNSGAGHIESAIQEVRKASRVYKEQLKSGYNLNDTNELEQIWKFTDVDRQLASFDNHPILTPSDLGKDPEKNQYEIVTKPVDVGIRYNADVSRKVDNSGNVVWDVNVVDKETGKTGKKTYASVYEAEFALEYLSGTSYKVPLSTLKRMGNYSFQYGEIDKNQISTPYLAPDFYKEVKDLENEMQLPFKIVGMTRETLKNKEVNGVDASRHLYGKGMDIQSNDTVQTWMMQNSAPIPNSEYRKLANTNLRFLTHDAGNGEHIHLEYTDTPDQIKTESDIAYLFN